MCGRKMMNRFFPWLDGIVMETNKTKNLIPNYNINVRQQEETTKTCQQWRRSRDEIKRS